MVGNIEKYFPSTLKKSDYNFSLGQFFSQQPYRQPYRPSSPPCNMMAMGITTRNYQMIFIMIAITTYNHHNSRSTTMKTA